MQSTEFKMTKKLSINWEITRQCNLSCAYCRVNGGQPQKNELDTKQVLKVIDELKKHKFGHLKFTGGEPLIRKDFWEIVEYARRKGFLVSLISNGLLIDDKVLALFKKNIFIVGISLDSIDEKTNKILGRLNYKLVLENIAKLVKEGLHVTILSTITKVNREQIPDLVKTAKKLGVDELKVNDMVLNGRAVGNSANLELERPLGDEVEKLALMVKTTGKEEPVMIKLFKCECNSDNLYIDYQGDLYPCVEMYYKSKEYCLGNTISDEIEKLLKVNEKFYQQIKDKDYCAYSYMGTKGFSACLNRAACPKSLRVYMENAKG
jgi:radical SAM protein with 4Fe4S-binding SPASM domain